MGKRNKRKRLRGSRAAIDLHYAKIQIELESDLPDPSLIQHWRAEIENWEKQYAKTERPLFKHRRKRKRGKDGES